jgi:hypothetical protein
MESRGVTLYGVCRKSRRLSIYEAYEEVLMEKIKEYVFSPALDASYEDAVSRVTDALKEETMAE